MCERVFGIKEYDRGVCVRHPPTFWYPIVWRSTVPTICTAASCSRTTTESKRSADPCPIPSPAKKAVEVLQVFDVDRSVVKSQCVLA